MPFAKVRYLRVKHSRYSLVNISSINFRGISVPSELSAVGVGCAVFEDCSPTQTIHVQLALDHVVVQRTVGGHVEVAADYHAVSPRAFREPGKRNNTRVEGRQQNIHGI